MIFLTNERYFHHEFSLTSYFTLYVSTNPLGSMKQVLCELPTKFGRRRPILVGPTKFGRELKMIFLENERYFHHGFLFTASYTYQLKEKYLGSTKKILLAQAL